MFCRVCIYILLIFLSGCGFKYKLFQDERTFIDENEYPITFQYTSKIVPSDKLSIDVYNNSKKIPLTAIDGSTTTLAKNSTQEYIVDSDGTIVLPILGEIKLAGLTEKEASKLLTQKYSLYLQDPFIKVKIANKRVYVFGESGASVMPIATDQVLLYEVLARAGGLGDGADKGAIQIISGELGSQKSRYIDMTRLSALNRSNLMIPANSIVYIQPRFMRSINMAVGDFNTIIGLITNTFSSYLSIDYIVNGRK